MYTPTRDDWELLPLSEEAKEALTSFFMAVLESDNTGDIEEAKKRFKDIRRKDMNYWFECQRRKDHGRNKTGA